LAEDCPNNFNFNNIAYYIDEETHFDSKNMQP
jgi:hypothetical protein